MSAERFGFWVGRVGTGGNRGNGGWGQANLNGRKRGERGSGVTFPKNCGRGRESIMLSQGVAHAQAEVQSGV